jgi:hypothetical protein
LYPILILFLCSYTRNYTTGARQGAGAATQADGKRSRSLESATLDTIVAVFAWYRIFGGADGGNEGLNGSLNANGLFEIFMFLSIVGQRVVDFGIGEGRVAASAIAFGAHSAFGYDFPANFAHSLNFSQVLDRMAQERPENENITDRGAWYGINIDTVGAYNSFPADLPQIVYVHYMQIESLRFSPTRAFSFWVGMPVDTQERILDLVANCLTIEALVVFRARDWKLPAHGIFDLARSVSFVCSSYVF